MQNELNDNILSTIEERRARLRNERYVGIERRREEVEELKLKKERILNEIEEAKSDAQKEIKSIKNNAQRYIHGYINQFRAAISNQVSKEVVEAYVYSLFCLDEKVAWAFDNRPRPNFNAAEIIRGYKRDNKELRLKINEFEYYFKELWSKDIDSSEKESFELLDDDKERTMKFLSEQEYLSLSDREKNQRAIDNYLNARHTKSYIGKMYERYIGFLYEEEGYRVQYRGIELGLKDGGIDLVCTKNKSGEVLLIQCKNWSANSIIYEKHICQLYGASRFYDKDIIQTEYSEGLFSEIEWERVTPVFVTTTQLDNHALEVAKVLGVTVRNIEFDRNYPMIKCNINHGVKIYHLPFDQMYDKTQVLHRAAGECYKKTVAEAEELGFRRAWRWRG